MVENTKYIRKIENLYKPTSIGKIEKTFQEPNILKKVTTPHYCVRKSPKPSRKGTLRCKIGRAHV